VLLPPTNGSSVTPPWFPLTRAAPLSGPVGLHDRVGSDHGVGLGLSIVRSVATTHGGSVGGRALPDGGLEITATLPVTSGPATQTYWSEPSTASER
jgi:hypothetical protein